MYQTEPQCSASIQNGSPCKSDWNLTHVDLALNEFCRFRFVMIHISAL